MTSEKVNSLDTKSQIVLAQELVRQHHFAEAIDICRGLETLNDPEAAMVHEIIGRALAESGQLAQGIEELTVALEHDSSNTTIRLDLAACLARAGRHAEVVEHLQNACAQDPTNPEIRLRLFSELFNLRRYREAHDELQTALSSKTHLSIPRSALYVLLAMSVWGQWGYVKRVLLIVVLMIGLIVPATRLVLWLLVSVITLVCLIALARGRLLQATRPILSMYGLLTLSYWLVVAFWR